MKYMNRQANLIVGYYSKLSVWAKILVISMFLIVVVSVLKRENKKEGFQQQQQFLVKQEMTDIYDDFYVDIYDYLVYNDIKDDYEIGEIVNKTGATEQSVVLDVGCGTGHHVGELTDKKMNAVGIDVSPNMIAKAKENYPQSKFEVKDILDSNAFQPNSFTHITCFYFTIYYIRDKRVFFQNCMNFLKPGGYLVIHLVNRNKFDPILPPGNPLIAISPQRYAKERITNTKIKFDDFEYDANFQLDEKKNTAVFVEKFKNDVNDKVRKHEHTFYMETQEDILGQAKDAGFILDSKIDLIKVSYEYQYLYILIKPN
jgi:SAM-dependent methyltransferase